MKYVCFSIADDDELHFGNLNGDEINEISDPFNGEEIEKLGKKFKREDVILLSPCFPTKAVCIGLNYRDHAEEMKLALPTEPVVFMKPSTSLLDPEGEIIYPSLSKRVDYEAELAVVIGKECHDVEEKDTHDYILGYCCANDVTARDLQPKQGQWTVAKGFDTFMPLGPYISDEVDPSNLKIECRLNGAIKQKSNTSNLIFSVPYLVSYISKVMTLLPGDVILTGTSSGIGPMVSGDVVEVEIEGLGVLKNSVL